MFATVKQIFNRKNRDLQLRILFTFGALSPTPIYFLILSKLLVGIYNIPSSLYFILI